MSYRDVEILKVARQISQTIEHLEMLFETGSLTNEVLYRGDIPNPVPRIAHPVS